MGNDLNAIAALGILLIQLPPYPVPNQIAFFTVAARLQNVTKIWAKQSRDRSCRLCALKCPEVWLL